MVPALPPTRFTPTDAAELSGYTRGLYSAATIEESWSFWTDAVEDSLAEDGVPRSLAMIVAPAVMSLLTKLREGTAAEDTAGVVSSLTEDGFGRKAAEAVAPAVLTLLAKLQG